MRILLLICLIAFAAGASAAQTGKSSSSADKGKAQQDDAVGTNIIGTEEAPKVLNVVPWKDKKVKLKKPDPTSFLTKQVLQPLDREVLMREVQYYRMLHDQKDDNSMFLQ